MNARKTGVDGYPEGDDEHTFLLDTTITDEELRTLRDSAFVFGDALASGLEKRETIVDTAMIRIDECAHGFHKYGEHRQSLRCAITDRELDALDTAAAEVNPTSLQQILTQIRNGVTSVETMYSVDLFAPLDFHQRLHRCGTNDDVFGVLVEGSTLSIPRFNDTLEVRTKLRTYLTTDERETLATVSASDVGGDEEVASLCNAVATAAEQFDPVEERRQNAIELAE